MTREESDNLLWKLLEVHQRLGSGQYEEMQETLWQAIEGIQARAERAEADRDEWRAKHEETFAYYEDERQQLDEMRRRAERAEAQISRLLNVAHGCHDYGGGYRGTEHAEAYHHGIQTVINTLEAALKDPRDTQIVTLERIGRDGQATREQARKEAGCQK